RRHCEETPWHPRQFNPEVTDEFVDLIADMMEKDPRRRMSSAAEVVARLAPWVPSQLELPQLAPHDSNANAPPVPTSIRDETVEDFGELTNAPTPDEPAAAAQVVAKEHRTAANGGASLETAHRREFKLPSDASLRTRQAVLRALTIAIPVSFLAGAALTYLFMEFLR
ncbi:MAG: hypothetical protein KDB23_33500, partial [Planctomycetales bacterium]|nr:hypothetical protein [Planctomycetales bacterium]